MFFNVNIKVFQSCCNKTPLFLDFCSCFLNIFQLRLSQKSTETVKPHNAVSKAHDAQQSVCKAEDLRRP